MADLSEKEAVTKAEAATKVEAVTKVAAATRVVEATKVVADTKVVVEATAAAVVAATDRTKVCDRRHGRPTTGLMAYFQEDTNHLAAAHDKTTWSLNILLISTS